MRVISSQSEAEICRRETGERLTYPLRQLTANLLRITRGAGKSYLLGNQLADCIELRLENGEPWPGMRYCVAPTPTRA
jgi:hypothetical protein